MVCPLLSFTVRSEEVLLPTIVKVPVAVAEGTRTYIIRPILILTAPLSVEILPSVPALKYKPLFPYVVFLSTAKFNSVHVLVSPSSDIVCVAEPLFAASASQANIIVSRTITKIRESAIRLKRRRLCAERKGVFFMLRWFFASIRCPVSFKHQDFEREQKICLKAYSVTCCCSRFSSRTTCRKIHITL